MAKFQLLNTETHHNLRVITQYQAGLGYSLGAIMVLACEIQEVQREYPVLFRKHSETGQFFPCALLGFEQHENLFLSAEGDWQADYIPLSIAKGPFLIGLEKNADFETQQPLVYVDIDDPRVGNDEGERLFNESGELSPYMVKVSQVLRKLHENVSAMQTMVDAFAAAELIEPVNMKLQFANGEETTFSGAYTIDAEKLRDLSQEQLVDLNKNGFLSAAYYIAGSLNNVQKLINIKNKQFEKTE